MHPAIAETISATQETSMPTEKQPAYHAVVHLVVPGTDENGNTISEAAAIDYISYTLQDRFLDWSYINTHEDGDSFQTPIQITVCKPYIEGTFIQDVES